MTTSEKQEQPERNPRITSQFVIVVREPTTDAWWSEVIDTPDDVRTLNDLHRYAEKIVSDFNSAEKGRWMIARNYRMLPVRTLVEVRMLDAADVDKERRSSTRTLKDRKATIHIDTPEGVRRHNRNVARARSAGD